MERIVAYLDVITVHALKIDLITLNIYDVGEARVALPQRVSPDLDAKQPSASSSRAKASGSGGILTDGSSRFRDSIAGTTGMTRDVFETLIAWAEETSSLPNVRLFTFTGIDGKRSTLLPRIMPDSAGLVTIWNDQQQPSIAVWRSVFDRLAPASINSVEQTIGSKIGQGSTVKEISSEVLKALKSAYREATEK